MTDHDPLCTVAALDPKSYAYDERAYYDCRCQLIKSVRADERARWQPRLPVVAGHVAACFCERCYQGEAK